MKGLQIKKVCGYWTLIRNDKILATSQKLSEVISIGENSGLFQVESIELKPVNTIPAAIPMFDSRVFEQELMIKGRY